MSVIDSRRYGRRSTASFTREEFEEIKNTPPTDWKKMEEEADRWLAERLKIDQEEQQASAASTDTPQ